MGRIDHRAVRGAGRAWAALLFIAAASGAAGQTIRSEPGGQEQRTYEFTSGGKIVEAGDKSMRRSAGRRTSRTGPELPRGAKNIPWDEPGKVSGVPGVLDNPATDLPGRSTRPRRKQAGVRSPAPQAQEAPSAPADARALASPRAEAPITSSAEATPARRDLQTPPAAVPAKDANLNATAEEAEARARLIERLKAAALADEQRRLEAEKSRDRFHRGSGHRSPEQRDAAAPQAATDPDHTGTVAAAREVAPEPKQRGWADRVCRLMFFGGC